MRDQWQEDLGDLNRWTKDPDIVKKVVGVRVADGIARSGGRSASEEDQVLLEAVIDGRLAEMGRRKGPGGRELRPARRITQRQRPRIVEKSLAIAGAVILAGAIVEVPTKNDHALVNAIINRRVSLPG